MLKVQLEKPDIILVESLDDINTNAIILNVIILIICKIIIIFKLILLSHISCVICDSIC